MSGRKSWWRWAPLAFAVVTVLFTLQINRYVSVYGDDYGYHTFVTDGLCNFAAKHFAHYLEDNGRFLVHLLVTIFLALPKVVWRIANSLLLGSFVYFGSKVVAGEDESLWTALATPTVLTSGVLALQIHMTRQSVYWLTGSMNYVYPVALLMVYWYLLERGPRGKACAALAFLSAASTEQGAMMTVGLGVLYLVRAVLAKERRDRIMACVLWSVLGMLTVVLAPSVFLRFGLESAEATPFAEMLKSNLKAQWPGFFVAKCVLPYQVVFLAASCLFLVSIWPRVQGKQRFLVLGSSASAALAIFIASGPWVGEAGVVTLSRILGLLVLSAIYVGLTAVILTFIGKRRHVSLFAFILLLGSQMMMVVSPVWGPRNALCAVLLLSFLVSFYAANVSGRTIRAILACALVVLFILSASNARATAEGYRRNAPVERDNIALLNEWNESGGTGELRLLRLPDDDYGWSMPYYSPYHEVYFKVWYGVPQNQLIQWIPYGE